MTLKIRVFFILLFLSFSSVWIFIISDTYLDKKELYTEKSVNELNVAYQVMISTHRETATLYFEEYINTPDILSLVKQASSVDEDHY